MKPVRYNFRLNVWPNEHEMITRQDSFLVSLEVSIKVRSRIFSEGLQKIMDKLEGRVDGTFGA